MTEAEAQCILLGPPPAPPAAYRAFDAWFKRIRAEDGNPCGLDKIGGVLGEAFVAGWMARGA
jgi:hypothetical protein